MEITIENKKFLKYFNIYDDVIYGVYELTPNSIYHIGEPKRIKCALLRLLPSSLDTLSISIKTFNQYLQIIIEKENYYKVVFIKQNKITKWLITEAKE
jgi:hypothetical protein